MKGRATNGLLLLGVISSRMAVALGWWHLRMALYTVFVFREGEPWTSWIVILFGPMATLPTALLSFYQREAAGYFRCYYVFRLIRSRTTARRRKFLGASDKHTRPDACGRYRFHFVERMRERVTD